MKIPRIVNSFYERLHYHILRLSHSRLHWKTFPISFSHGSEECDNEGASCCWESLNDIHMWDVLEFYETAVLTFFNATEKIPHGFNLNLIEFYFKKC